MNWEGLAQILFDSRKWDTFSRRNYFYAIFYQKGYIDSRETISDVSHVIKSLMVFIDPCSNTYK